MKKLVTKIRNKTLLFFIGATSLVANSAPVDLTQDTSGGKKFSDVASNLSKETQYGAGLLIELCTLTGFCMVAVCLYQLWRAAKDEREKPLGSIAGLIIGGLMTSISGVLWLSKNTSLGS